MSKYVIVTPVRNEQEYLGCTIESLAKQTALPALWVVVDDGSTDATPDLVTSAQKKHPWIRLIRRADRGSRQPGTGVVQAFAEGLGAVDAPDWEFLVKLDGDLSFSPNYFELCFRQFAANSKLGIGGGTISQMKEGNLVTEAPGDPAFHVRGATKIYRRACWEQIGGLIAAPGWDTVDEYKANMLGWETRTFPDIRIRHHRIAGGAQGTWKNWVKNGLANYIAGYHPLFMLAKCLARLPKRPVGVMAAGLFVGYFMGFIKGVPRSAEKEVITYMQGQQLRKLFFRKSLWNE